jgi:chromosome partitioning protein
MQNVRRPLRTLAVVSSKGGSGKTTLALHLAVSAEAAGRRTIVADTDPQKSAWEWRQARAHAAPEVAVMQPEMITRFQGPIERSGYEFMIIDTAPFAGPGVEAAPTCWTCGRWSTPPSRCARRAGAACS